MYFISHAIDLFPYFLPGRSLVILRGGGEWAIKLNTPRCASYTNYIQHFSKVKMFLEKHLNPLDKIKTWNLPK